MANSNAVYIDNFTLVSPNGTALSSPTSYYGLSVLPPDIRSDLENNYYEPGIVPSVFKYFESLPNEILENIMQDIFIDAMRQKKHRVVWNIMVILSEFSYEQLGEWAAFLAESALKSSSYPDVVELGIRCFENWEDKKACERLRKNSFKQHWLQEYADEVCEYIEQNGRDVTLFNNHNWSSNLRPNYQIALPIHFIREYKSCTF